MYREMKDRQQKRVDEFLHRYAFFAFSDKQLEEGLQRLGLTEEEAPHKLVKLSNTGGYVLKEHSAELQEIFRTNHQEEEAALADPDTGPRYAFEMFYYELCNHEYCITGNPEETLDALGYTLEEVNADPVLKSAFEEAKEKALEIE